MSLRFVWWVLGAVLVWHTPLMAQRTARQEAETAFERGTDARNARRWMDAARYFREAVAAEGAERPDRVGRTLMLLGGTEYLPHFFLGEALLQLDDCAGALGAWAVSEEQGVVRRFADRFKALQEGKSKCEARGVLPRGKYEEALQTARTAVEAAAAANAAFDGLRKRSLPEAMTPERTGQAQTARQDLGLAQKSLETGAKSRTQQAFADASAAARRAAAAFSGLSNELEVAVKVRDAFAAQLTGLEGEIESAVKLDAAIVAGRRALSPSMDEQRARGMAALNASRKGLATARANSNPAALSEASSSARAAADFFRGVLGELDEGERLDARRRIEQATRGARERFALLDSAVSTYDGRAVKRPEVVDEAMKRERQSIQGRIQTSRRDMTTAVAAANPAAIEAAGRAAQLTADRLAALILKFGPRTLVEQGVHPALEQGARYFLAGQYADALQALSPAEGFADDVPLRLHIHLLKAASLYELFLRGGERDAAQREQALAEAASAKALAPAHQPQADSFSPRFIAWFARVSPGQLPTDGAAR